MLKTIKIKYRQEHDKKVENGHLEVKGHIYQHLAVHRNLHQKGYWTITHIPSGMSVIQSCKSFKDARKLTLQLNKTFDWNWTESPPWSQEQINFLNRMLRPHSWIIRKKRNSFPKTIVYKGVKYDVPSDDEISNMITGFADTYSIKGVRCDPYGYDNQGFPSWLELLFHLRPDLTC